jgi:hypothetical protein
MPGFAGETFSLPLPCCCALLRHSRLAYCRFAFFHAPTPDFAAISAASPMAAEYRYRHITMPSDRLTARRLFISPEHTLKPADAFSAIVQLADEGRYFESSISIRR